MVLNMKSVRDCTFLCVVLFTRFYSFNLSIAGRSYQIDSPHLFIKKKGNKMLKNNLSSEIFFNSTQITKMATCSIIFNYFSHS